MTTNTYPEWEQELDAWEQQYRPIKNRLNGEELDFVMAQDPRCIWTLVDGDDGNLYIVSGYHLVNRINYFVTEVPYEGNGMDVPYYIFDEEEETE